jgi:hypothetical protein
MKQDQVLKKLRSTHWKSLLRIVQRAYQEGVVSGMSRARGMGRRGRTIRDDATVESLTHLIQQHFGLDRYAFEVRIVHPSSGRRVPAGDLIRSYRLEDE